MQKNNIPNSKNTSNNYEYDFFGQQSLNEEQYRNQLNSSQKTYNQSHFDKITYQNEFIHAVESFMKAQCLKTEQLRRMMKCVSKLQMFKRLGLLLFQTCLYEFNLIISNQKFDRLQTIREGIYDNLQQLIVIFGKDKQRYLGIIPLIYCAILKKMFTVSKKSINSDQKCRLFHVIFFQIKGQLISDQFLQSLIAKHFNQNYNKFIKQYSENITPVKLKKEDKSLTKIESKKALNVQDLNKYIRINKENTPTQYETNKNLLTKYISNKTPKNNNNEELFGTRKNSPNHLVQIRRRLPI